MKKWKIILPISMIFSVLITFITTSYFAANEILNVDKALKNCQAKNDAIALFTGKEISNRIEESLKYAWGVSQRTPSKFHLSVLRNQMITANDLIRFVKINRDYYARLLLFISVKEQEIAQIVNDNMSDKWGGFPEIICKGIKLKPKSCEISELQKVVAAVENNDNKFVADFFGTEIDRSKPLND